jgi:hypothetical protein
MTAFFDFLQHIRGDYISKIDQLLAPIFQDYLEGKRPGRLFPFEAMDLEDMQRESMDSQFFVAAYHAS